MQLSEFLNKEAKHKTIEYLPTVSYHGNLAKKILNALLCENSKYENAIYALSILPALIWQEKAKIVLNKNNKDTIEHSKVGSMVVGSHIIEENENEINTITETIISTLKKGIRSVKGQEGICLKAVHLNGEDVSNFIMNTYYKNGVQSLYAIVGETIDEAFSSLGQIFEQYEEEDILAMHDYNMLFTLYRSIDKNKKKSMELKDSIYEAMLEVAKSLGTYIENPAELKKIMTSYIKGSTEEEISKNVGKSRTYVRAKIEEGKEACAVLLWGLTTKRTINWIRK